MNSTNKGQFKWYYKTNPGQRSSCDEVREILRTIHQCDIIIHEIRLEFGCGVVRYDVVRDKPIVAQNKK